MIACCDESAVSLATGSGRLASTARAGSSRETTSAVLQARAAPVQTKIRFHRGVSKRLISTCRAGWNGQSRSVVHEDAGNLRSELRELIDTKRLCLPTRIQDSLHGKIDSFKTRGLHFDNQGRRKRDSFGSGRSWHLALTRGHEVDHAQTGQ